MTGSTAEGGLGTVGDSGMVACADCHDPAHWFTDTRSVPNRTSLGTARTKRNSPSIVNAVYYEWGGWAGAHDQMWKQAATVIENRDALNGDRLTFAHVIYDHYRDDFARAVRAARSRARRGGHVRPVPAQGQARRSGVGQHGRRRSGARQQDRRELRKALEAYERRIVSGNAPFDRYVAEEPTALTESAKRGLKLFIGKAACATCHEGPTFTDQRFHNTGVSQQAPDGGRVDDAPRLVNAFNGAGPFSDDPIAGQAKLAEAAQLPVQPGEFRTKSLRHLTETGPYFHDGSAETLEDVVRFYNRGGGEPSSYPGAKDAMLVLLNLTDGEVADLVEFLRALTGDPVPSELTRNPALLAPRSR